MSTIAYAQLTNKRDEAQPGTSTTTSNPGIKSYIDAFAALVPAEVLTLHALIISAATKTDPATAAGAVGTTTTILPGAVHALTATFWILIALSVILFVVPRYFGGKWDKFDYVRASIAPLAFVGWTMLQRATAFDAVFPNVSQIDRTVYALILGAVLGGVTAALAAKADAKPSS
jgi:hypothetical protein